MFDGLASAADLVRRALPCFFSPLPASTARFGLAKKHSGARRAVFKSWLVTWSVVCLEKRAVGCPRPSALPSRAVHSAHSAAERIALDARMRLARTRLARGCGGSASAAGGAESGSRSRAARFARLTRTRDGRRAHHTRRRKIPAAIAVGPGPARGLRPRDGQREIGQPPMPSRTPRSRRPAGGSGPPPQFSTPREHCRLRSQKTNNGG